MHVSCKQETGYLTGGHSAFDSVIAVADRMGDSGRSDEALRMVQHAHSTMKTLSMDDHILYYTWSNVRFNNEGKHDRSIEVADSLLGLLSEASESPSIATARIVAYNIKADALFAMGLYNDAYNYYYIAQKMAVDNKDSCAMRTYTYSLAMTLFRQARYQQSAKRFIEALAQSRACNREFNLFYFQQEVLDNIGLCYNALGKYDSAMLFYKQALTFINDNKGMYATKPVSVFEAAKAVVYGNMAEVHMHQGRYDSARILYEYSININLRRGYANKDALISQIKLADLLFRAGEVGSSRNILRLVGAELDSIPDKRVEMLWHKLMWEHKEYEHDSLDAFRHLRMYTLQNEDYIKANKSLMETDLDMRVRDLEKQYRINLLTKDRRQQNIWLLVMALIVVMAIAIIFLVLRNARRSRRNLTLMTELNDTINKQKQQLEGAIRELKNKEKDKTRILRSVAHDVMNPIAAIVSLTDILFYDKETLNEEQIHVINLIREASANSLNLSKDIIEAAEQNDDQSLEKEDTDINMLVARTVELLNFRALSKRQQIITRYPAEHIHSRVFKDKIRRVINNLVANAIKFSYEGTVIHVTLELTKKGMVHLMVRDSGIGIPSDKLPHVFDVFTDARQAGTMGEITHGLGLSISMQIAKAHNGDIWVESEEGKGATFHFEFPVQQG